MTHPTRRSVLALGGLGLASLATGCNGTAVQQASPTPGAAASSGPGRAVIGLTYIPNIQFAPFYWALDKGLYSARGVQASLRHHGASEGLFNALVAGQEDFAIAGGDEVLQANSEGMDLVVVAGYYQRYPVVLVVPQDSPIRTLADLEGRRVGVPGKYGESWYGLQLALHQAGLSASQVRISQIGYTQQAALATGKVDAIVGFANNDVVQFATSGVKVRAIGLGEDVPLVSTSIVTSRRVLEQRRDMVEAVCRASVEGVAAVVADPQAAVATSVAHVPGLSAASAQSVARRTLDATIPLWKGSAGSPDGRLDAARFSRMGTFMREAGLLSRPVDAARAVDTTVLD